MIDILIDLLSPLFVSLGASKADVSTYAHLVEGYLNVILIGLLVMAAVMVAAHWLVKKGTRHVVRWSAALAWVLVVTVCLNLICLGPLNPILTSVTTASKVEISDDVVGNSKAVIRETGEEGIVLVKNNGLLPLKETKQLNVFGWASVFPVYSGTGSGNAGDAGPATSLMASLRDAGFETNGDLMQLYLNWSKEYKTDRPSITMQNQDWTLPEPTREAYTSSLMSSVTAFSDTAVIVIGRSGGENSDLPADMNAVIHGTFNLVDQGAIPDKYKGNYGYTGGVYHNNGDYDDFEPGEHYLELSRTEEDLVDLVCSSFQNVVVVVNANNAMELGWVDEHPEIGAVLLVPGTGNTGMVGLGEILAGTVNPSGKTVDTYVKDLTATPTFQHYGNSGNHLYTGVDDLVKRVGRNDISFQGVFSFVDYVEGIYMGYKYYETAADDGAIKYEDHVQYPFGYGLSYTTFEQKIRDFKQDSTTLSVSVEVTNTGSAAGKDVVELYFTPPYVNGGIEKASVNLLDFGKTGLLEPGASETVSFSIPLESLASYDSGCVKTASGGYILEAGEYKVSIRSDSHTVLDERTFSLSSDVDYSKDGRPSDGIPAENRFESMDAGREYLSRKDKFANYEKVTAAPTDFSMSKDTDKAIQKISVAKYDPTDHDDDADVMPIMGADNGLKLADLTGKPYDDPDWDMLLDQLSLDDMITLVNTGGWKTVKLESVGKISTNESDGPQGLSNYQTRNMGTQFAASVLMAQSWNKDLAGRIGEAIAQEFANANSYGIYGPAMNLHRSAFGGRNYEYYSEDGTFSGLFASAEVNGMAKYGVYAFMKHFAGNDQETNRNAFLLTYMSEQTFRENVLKPFELVVKNFDFDHYVLGAMSSYNWLGTVPAISSRELLTTVLRDEWGFTGMVISDYNGSYGYQISDAAVRAGNDLMLGNGVADSNKFTDTDAASCVLALRQACKNILYTVGNSGYYADPTAVEETGGESDGLTRLLITVDVIVGLAVVAAEALVILRWLKKRGGSAPAKA